MRILQLVFVLLFLSGCALKPAIISNVNVIKKGTDSAGAFCSDFSLTNTQVFKLLKSSREVEINEFHNNYEYLPCFVKGNLNMEAKRCEFTIRAGGTVELTCNDGTGYLYVCDSCDHLLIGNE